MRRYYSVSAKKFIDKDGQEVIKYYPNAVSAGHFSSEDMAKDISEATSLSEPDVVGALKAFSIVLKNRLKLGYKIKLDGIGTFSLSVTGEPCDSEKECKPNKVKVGKITFKAEAKLRKEMVGIKFYKTNKKRNRK
ncbi:MAG: HU family DNA-binding protein [Bacteroidales bacterium]|nr:HU family DNA-binding protein [Bacteroidales bacterium]